MTGSDNSVLVTDAQVEAARMLVERDRAEGRDPSESVVTIASAKPSPENQLLMALVGQLDSITAKILLLRVGQELTIEQIAVALNMTPQQVRARQRQGLNQLRKWLSEAELE